MSKLQNEVFRMYLQGMKIVEISKKMGINEAIIREMIKQKAKSQ